MDYHRTQEDIEQREKEVGDRISEITALDRSLTAELASLTRELTALQQMRLAIEVAVGLRPAAETTLAARVRTVMRETRVPLTPVQIRELCETAGIRGSSRKNQLIAIHAVLRRMRLREQVRVVRVAGKIAYLPP